MNEIQIYSILMFMAGVGLTHAVFYFDRQTKLKKFYLRMSAIILQILDNINLVHMASTEFAKEETKTVEDSKAEEYLLKEQQKLSVFMELYVLLFIKAVPPEGRKYLNYRSWPEASSLIEELRGFMNNEQDKGRTLGNKRQHGQNTDKDE